MFNLGVLVEDDDPAEARRWYERAAAHDHTDAMYNLGVLLEDSDPVEAPQWYERAAALDHAGAMYNLGDLLRDGDPAEARRLYERAAADDHAGAMFNLGVQLEESDPTEARRWYERAAAQDHTGAVYNLGVLLEESDPTQARRWLRTSMPTFKDRRLSSISPSDVRSWHGTVAHGHPSTRAGVYALLRAILNTAVEDRVIGMTPCTIKGGGQKETPSDQWLPLPRFVPCSNRCPNGCKWWCCWRRGAPYGVGRSSGYGARTWTWPNGTITIVQTRDVAIGGEWVVKGPKSQAGYRTVAIPPSVISALEGHLDTYVGPDRDDLVLTDDGGEPLHPRTLQRAWVTARDSIGRPELHLHDLRHTGNTWATSTGASTKELMARMGHSTPRARSSTSTATPDRDRAIANALDGLVTGSPQRAATNATNPRSGPIPRPVRRPLHRQSDT